MSNDRLRQILPRYYGFEATLHETFSLASEAAKLEGDLVECGIAQGASVAVMKLAAPNKMVWGYDSFEGIQLAGRHDEYQPGFGERLDPNREIPSNLLVSSGVTVHHRDHVENHLVEWGFGLDGFKLVEGWIQNTVYDNQPDKIALLRLDMDMHDPTVVALEVLFPKLVKGGILIIDDWGYAGVRKALNDYFEKIDYKPDWQTPGHTGFLRK